jgi:hypothetical protein
MSDYMASRDAKARKEHRCDWCRQPIPLGELHRVDSGHFDGYAYRLRKHWECSIASAENPCVADYRNLCDGCDHCELGCEHPRGGYTTDNCEDGEFIQVFGAIVAA